ncbi:MAG: acyltransferase [Desulfuromonadales bacterium]
MNANLKVFLNFSRWFAAFLVVINHVRHLVLVDFKNVEHKTIVSKVIYFVTGLGHESVVVFFVISGLLVGGITFDRWRAQGANLRAYTSARVSRIYTVLVPSLLAGFAFDFIGMQWFNSSELYTNAAQYNTISLNSSISAALDLPTFVGNLFMMQGVLTGTFGSNGPLWSLANEWWYYCIFALVAAALTDTGIKRSICAVMAIAITVVLPVKIMLWSIIWMLGIAAHYWISSSSWRPHPAIGAIIFTIAVFVSRVSHNVDNTVSHESMLTEFARDFMLGIAYVILLAGMSRLKVREFLPRFHERLADFSYTTYLIHFPAMLLIVAFGYQVFDLKFQIQPGGYGILYLSGLTIILYCFCFVFYQLAERQTLLVKRTLDAFFGIDRYGADTRSAFWRFNVKKDEKKAVVICDY